MATSTRYVNTSSTAGGNGTTNATGAADPNRAYVSLTEWETGRQANLTTSAGTIERCYFTSSATADISALAITGWTTSASSYIEIIAASGARHAGKWSATRALTYVSNATAIAITEEYVRIDGMQIQSHTPSANARHPILYDGLSGVNNIIVTHSILKGHNSVNRSQYGLANNTGYSVYLIAYNNVIYNLNVACAVNTCIRIYASPSYPSCIYANSISGGYYGIRNYLNTTYAKNNCVASSGSTQYLETAGTLYCVNNSSSDDTADNQDGDGISGGNRINTTPVWIDPANGDLHLSVNDTACINVGTTLSADPLCQVTDDIDYVVRAGVWDIGCDEYVATAAGGMVSTTATTIYQMRHATGSWRSRLVRTA